MSTPAGDPGTPEQEPPVGPTVQPPELPPAPPLSAPLAAPPAPGRRRPLIIAFILGLASYGAVFVPVLASDRDAEDYRALVILLGTAQLALVELLAGLVLVSFRATRQWGVGLLLSVAVGVIVGSGTCLALLANP